MLDDDGSGLLVNFDSSPATGVVFSGIKKQDNKSKPWKQRRREKILLRDQNQPRQDQNDKEVKDETNQKPKETQEKSETPRTVLPRTVKPKTKSSKPSKPSKPSKHTREGREQTRESAQKRAEMRKESGFVSSLFSANPEPEIETVKAQEPGQSTNSTSDSQLESLNVNPSLCKVLESKGITHTTAIQQAAVPVLLNDQCDAIMVAQTGSGKTLAYLLPILHKLMQQPSLHRSDGIFAVILAPTRELAAQIYGVLESLLKACHWLVPCIVVGGEKKKSEKARLRKGVNVLVATPGRLADHLENTNALDFSQVRWVVLDEGDRLVELGFEETLTQILDGIKKSSNLSASPFDKLPRKCSHVICSATMSASIQRLKVLTLEDPVWIQEAQASSNESVPSQLQQRVVVVPGKLRLVTLVALLKGIRNAPKKVVVFFSCTDSVNFHFAALSGELDSKAVAFNGRPGTRVSKNATIFRLHGSLSQGERSHTLQSYASCKGIAILLCTDVASRGLDINVDQVVEFDPAFAVEDHIHRVGRTARAGKAGTSSLFLLPGSEEEYMAKLEPLHPSTIQKVNYKTIVQVFGSKWQDEATEWQLDVERWVLGDVAALELAKKAFISHIRAYSTHISSEKSIFNLKTLHMGHLAKSFALRETPKQISNQFERREKTGKPPKKQKMLDVAQRHTTVSDFNIA